MPDPNGNRPVGFRESIPEVRKIEPREVDSNGNVQEATIHPFYRDDSPTKVEPNQQSLPDFRPNTADTRPGSVASGPGAMPGFRPLETGDESTLKFGDRGSLRYSSVPKDAFVHIPTPGNDSPSDTNLNLRFRLNSPGLEGQFPLLPSSGNIQNPDVKLGPLYFKVVSATASLLATDNANETERNREGGAIAITELNLQMVAQITESFSLAANGTLVYFPIQNRVGFTQGGSNLLNYSLGLGATLAPLVQLVWSTEINEWPIKLTDTFTQIVGNYSFSSGTDLGYFEGHPYDQQDQVGRYIFRPPATQATSNQFFHSDPILRTEDAEVLTARNVVEVETARVLPGDIAFRAAVFQENLFDEAHTDDRQRGVEFRQGANVSLVDIRDNTRFQPFFEYQALRTSETENFDHTFLLGIRGPIDDKVRLKAVTGMYIDPENNVSRLLWEFTLLHEAGRSITEELSFQRNLSYFHDALETSVYYGLQVQLGPRLSSTFYFDYFRDEDLLNQFQTTEGYRSGLRFNWVLGPKTTARIEGIYSHFTGYENSDNWRFRLRLGYDFTDTFRAHFLYEFQDHHATGFSFAGENFYENLLVLQFVKTFH